MQIRVARDLGLVVRDRRRALGMTQDALASKIGVSRQWIVAIEKGKPRAAFGHLLRLLNTLDLALTVNVKSEISPELQSRQPQLGIDIDAVIDNARRVKR